jgi:hypothetical protein
VGEGTLNRAEQEEDCFVQKAKHGHAELGGAVDCLERATANPPRWVNALSKNPLGRKVLYTGDHKQKSVVTF